MTRTTCLCVFVCVLSSRRLVCRPSHLCVCRVGTPPSRIMSRLDDSVSIETYELEFSPDLKAHTFRGRGKYSVRPPPLPTTGA